MMKLQRPGDYDSDLGVTPQAPMITDKTEEYDMRETRCTCTPDENMHTEGCPMAPKKPQQGDVIERMQKAYVSVGNWYEAMTAAARVLLDEALGPLDEELRICREQEGKHPIEQIVRGTLFRRRVGILPEGKPTGVEEEYPAVTESEDDMVTRAFQTYKAYLTAGNETKGIELALRILEQDFERRKLGLVTPEEKKIFPFSEAWDRTNAILASRRSCPLPEKTPDHAIQAVRRITNFKHVDDRVAAEIVDAVRPFIPAEIEQDERYYRRLTEDREKW